MSNYFYPEERIAIVGMGALFPDANNINLFWNNILSKKVSIKEVPDSVFDKGIFYNPNVLGKINKNDKSYTKIAAIVDVDNYADLTKKFKIPPTVAEHMDPNQHVAIYCVDQALQSLANSNINKERAAVIMGIGAPGRRYDNIIRRTFYERVEEYLRHNSKLNSNLELSEMDELLKELAKITLKDSIPITEDSAPGMLQSITAARITNLFDFYGPSYTVDAACASALAAATSGITGLLNGEYDVLVTGGVDVTLDETPFVVFSAINALSPSGCFPFDSRANGFVTGLGGGALILKRLGDAIRDGDRIYALISGFGQGSDGKGKYIAAPNEEGQVRVVQNALSMAGYHVDTIEYIEAHGTGTTVGDVVELGALKKAFQALGATKQNYCGVGSVKSNIGHLRYASGAPGLIKASLALYNKVLPPTANIQIINPKLKLEGSPFYILTDEKPWQENSSYPRRANVSAYGFGGADYHITLEEFRPEFLKKTYSLSKTAQAVKTSLSNEEADSLPEVVFFSGDSIEEIKESCIRFIESYKDSLDFGSAVLYNNSSISSKKDLRLAFCINSMKELMERYNLFDEFTKQGKLDNTQALNLKGIYFGKGEAVTSDKVTWMFPGQASQYPNMLKGIYETYPIVESLYMQVDAVWKAKYGYDITSLIFGSEEEYLEKELKNTKNTHPAVFLSSIAMYKLLSESGLKADYMIGHSLGEVSALYASGMLDLRSAVGLVGERGFSFDSIPQDKRGIMVSVKADKSRVEDIIKENGFRVDIANINSPEQTVVGGNQEEIDKMAEFLGQNKITHTKLNVSHAFHTSLTSDAAESFYNKIADIRFNVPGSKVMACHLVDFYPDIKDRMNEIPSILKEQIISTVNFTDSILKLYEKGVRIFVEAGPSSILTNLVKNILSGKDVKVIASNNRKKDPVEAYKLALAELFTSGIDICTIPSIQDLVIGTGRDKPAQTLNNLKEDVNNQKEINTLPSKPSVKESIVYSGVSVGLPGTFKNVFSDDNFDLLFEGKNLIEMLTDDEMNSLVDLNITRLIKSEGVTTFKKLSSINEVIQLAGKLGKIDMLSDYQVDEKIIKQMTLTVCAGVAAGYEALKDAGIPLVREQVKTAAGSSLPGRLVLPEEMQEDTGIIFANGFIAIEPFISEVSKYIASKFGRKTRNDLINFYEAVISKVSDYNVKKILSDWFTLHYSRLLYNSGEEDIYEFNHDFMGLVSSQANNRLAQFIGAMGPNFYISAACSSTASAVTVAEDLIRAGHAGRMIVIGSENVTSKTALPWVGASFLSMGAATDSSNVFEAAVPFDNRRNGMILGAGAVGLVLEKEEDVARRGMNGVCRILGTHAFNTAGHQAKIDSNRYCIELDKFMTKMEKEYKLDRKSIASKTVYYSHETYSPRRGGCSQTEKMALERAFGEKYRDIKVINTKGMTGHTMAASIEEAVAAKALQYQKIPPVANYREPDPELEGLNLSQGGSYNFEFVIRMVTGYGAQGNYHLLQKLASGDQRIFDNKLYQEWLRSLTHSQDVKLKKYGRLLVAEGDVGGQIPGTYTTFSSNDKEEREEGVPRQVNFSELKEAASFKDKPSSQDMDIKGEILSVYSEVTKYPIEMLDLSMEVEADLGIDTVKQATIFSIISEKFNISEEEGLKLSNYPTIGHIVSLIQEKVGAGPKSEKSNTVTTDKGLSHAASIDCSDEVFKVISEITKYPVEMLEKDMEMEADLGIDTVKQATIFSLLSQKFGIDGEQSLNISQYRTIGAVIDFISTNYNGKSINLDDKKVEQSKQVTYKDSITPKVERDGSDNKVFKEINGTDNIEQEVMKVISEVTKYPVEMLERDMEMEADLGIDTVKQATIFSIINDKFKASGDDSLNISQYRTIGSLVDMIKESIADKSSYSNIDNKKTPDPEEEPAEIDENAEVGKIERDLCLQIPVFVEEEVGKPDFDLKDRNIWVIGDHKEMVRRISGYFKDLSGNVEEFVFSVFNDASELYNKAGEFCKKDVDVIVDCTHIGADVEFDKISRNQEERIIFLNSEARFIFYKKLGEKLHEPEIRIVCAVSMDGCHGYLEQEQKSIDPFYGALCGFYKGLGKEWKKSSIKIVDLCLEGVSQLSDDSIAKLANELEISSFDCEIGYMKGKRVVLRIDYLDRTDFKEVEFSADTHFVITGGGYGITSEIIRGLSKRFKGKFTIIGRTCLPEDIKDLSQLNERELSQKKLEIQKILGSKHERVTPLMIQEEFEKILRAISVYNLVNEVERNGSKALYLSCDVRDYENLQIALEKSVEQNGPVNVLIHAAGIEKSRLLREKPGEEFNLVFSVKAEGACNIYRLIDKKELKAVIGFSSISGRFGNEAQVDYCAANSFINSFIAMIKAKHKGIHALSISWSGWKDTGMAWRNEFVKKYSEEMGLHLIEPERGTEEFINVLTNNVESNEIIISKGLHHFVSNKMMKDSLNETPFIDWVTKRNGTYEKAFKIFSVKRDPIMDHHRLGITPLTPAVAFMELYAEYHSLHFGRKEQYCFRDIRIDRPLKLFHEKAQEVIMVAHPGIEPESFRITSYTYLDLKLGISKLVSLNNMSLSSRLGDYQHLLEAMCIENEAMEEGFIRDSLNTFNERQFNSIRLGTLFVDERKENSVFRRNKNGAVYSVFLPGEQVTNAKYQLEKLLVNPAFMDAVFQTCGVHSQYNSDRVYLPWEVKEFGIVKAPRELGLYKCYARLKSSSDELKVYDVVMVNEKGEVCYYAKDVTMRRINS
ncbi:MAG: SDR family NAD(P)-dependent oxidoreductase [Bacillota bacterium]